MKTSFVLYTEYMSFFEALTLEEKGMLLEAIFAYEAGIDLPEMDSAVKVAFSFIKKRLDISDENYKEKCAKNAENAKKGGRPKKTEKTQDNPVGFEKTERKRTVTNGYEENPSQANANECKRKNPDNDSDNDNDFINRDIVSFSSSLVNNIPTLTELTNYISKNNLNVNPKKFYDHYSKNGWSKVKDWKQAVSWWDKTEGTDNRKKTSEFNKMQQQDYNMTALEKALKEHTERTMNSG